MYEFFGAVPNPQPKPVSTCLGELEVWKCEPSASARDPCQSDEACSSSAESRTTFSNTKFRISTLPAHSILHTKQPPAVLTRGMVIASVHEGDDVDTCEFAESRLRMPHPSKLSGCIHPPSSSRCPFTSRRAFSRLVFWRWESSVGTITVENRRGC